MKWKYSISKLQNAAKTMLRRKFTANKLVHQKLEWYQIKNLTVKLKYLEQIKPKIVEKIKILNIRE